MCSLKYQVASYALFFILLTFGGIGVPAHNGGGKEETNAGKTEAKVRKVSNELIKIPGCEIPDSLLGDEKTERVFLDAVKDAFGPDHAGPMAKASTDDQHRAAILPYSRSERLFGGIASTEGVITPYDDGESQFAYPANTFRETTGCVSFPRFESTGPVPFGRNPRDDKNLSYWNQRGVTGDWSHFRSKMAERGFNFEFIFTRFFQTIGRNKPDTFDHYINRFDLLFNVDPKKPGLWEGSGVQTCR